MSLFYKVSDKESLKIRHQIVKEVALPELEKNGFAKSPFPTSWYRQYDRNIHGYSYTLCRLDAQQNLETLTIYTVRGDVWIKINLYIYRLQPTPATLSDLQISDGLQFGTYAHWHTNMRLRSDDYKGPPLFYMLFCPEHNFGSYYTRSGFEKQVTKLRELVRKDMKNIDRFVKRWHELHQPALTDWDGNKIER